VAFINLVLLIEVEFVGACSLVTMKNQRREAVASVKDVWRGLALQKCL